MYYLESNSNVQTDLSLCCYCYISHDWAYFNKQFQQNVKFDDQIDSFCLLIIVH